MGLAYSGGFDRFDIAVEGWLTVINNVRIDNDPTTYNSAVVNTSGYAALTVLIAIDSTLAPTTLRILPQWSDDGGVTWWDFEEGYWASLMWEDTATAAGINKGFLLPCAGIDLVRFRIVGVGTDATNYFDVTLLARGVRGGIPVAHA